MMLASLSIIYLFIYLERIRSEQATYTSDADLVASQREQSEENVVKPARLHFARTARALTGRCVSEASCPNFQPRAHAGLTSLTKENVERSRAAAAMQKTADRFID